jgi:hypothetical protein
MDSVSRKEVYTDGKHGLSLFYILRKKGETWGKYELIVGKESIVFSEARFSELMSKGLNLAGVKKFFEETNTNTIYFLHDIELDYEGLYNFLLDVKNKLTEGLTS